jgi:alpha-ribazole phosphatase
MTAIDFLRHGATDAGDVLLGRTDPPLSAQGRDAVLRLTAGRTWSAIVASPLRRARETAEIAARHSDFQVELDPAWREIDFGDWDGMGREELAADARHARFQSDPDANPPPQGESIAEVRARVVAALERLAPRGPGPILVVAHGGTIRVALSELLAIPLPRLWALRIACATRIRVDLGADPVHGLWGEIVEIAQPEPGPIP